MIRKYFERQYICRYIIIIVSMMLNGLGLSIMRISCMGTDPFNSMNYSFSELLQMPLGIVVIGVSCVLLVLSFFVMRSSVGVGTIANMVLLGTSADFWRMLITKAVGKEIVFTGMEELTFRVFLVCLGIFLMVFFNAFYISANLGMSPYDALGYIIEKVSGGFPFKWARIIIDSLCVIIAYFVAAKSGKQWEVIGVGTIIMAFGTGPLLSFFRERVAEPFIKKVCKEPVK